MTDFITSAAAICIYIALAALWVFGIATAIKMHMIFWAVAGFVFFPIGMVFGVIGLFQ